jgi:hypothetical protein
MLEAVCTSRLHGAISQKTQLHTHHRENLKFQKVTFFVNNPEGFTGWLPSGVRVLCTGDLLLLTHGPRTEGYSLCVLKCCQHHLPLFLSYSDTTDETRNLYFTPPLKTVFDEVKTHHIPMRTNFMEMQAV